ncbi:MAG: GNAT family N-acetyltransferase [Planctomycetes bacterium]|nr:GNAT family N-acetyltransferase [Planctomycetota bacterium]
MTAETEALLSLQPIEELQPGSFDEARQLIDRCMRPEADLSMSLDFPLLVGAEARARRLVVRSEGRIVAHAAGRLLRVATPARRSFALFDIGAVCTDPAERGRGHARRLVTELLQEARLAGVEAAILWAEVEGFYEKLGFAPAGLETRFLIEPRRLGLGQEADVWPLRQQEIPDLMRLRRQDAFPVRRSLDEARILFNIPRCETRVALEGGRVVAYASLGKGLDFQGVISEWGGVPELVPALARDLMLEFGLEQAMVMGPTWDRRYLRAFSALGFTPEHTDMAMMTVLNGRRLRQALQPHFEQPLPAGDEDLAEALFGRSGLTPPDRVLPFFVWGLDSV